MKIKKKGFLSWLLSVALIVTMTGMPVYAVESDGTEGMIEIVSFAPLNETVSRQTVPYGTPVNELDLPDKLIATVLVMEEELVDDEEEILFASESDAIEDDDIWDTQYIEVEKKIRIPVDWESDSLYDGNLGEYTFTTVLADGAYTTSEELPEIIVTVQEDVNGDVAGNISSDAGKKETAKDTNMLLGGRHEKTITEWEWIDEMGWLTQNAETGVWQLELLDVSVEKTADFDTVVSMLPPKVLAKVWAEMDGAAHDSREIISDDIEDIPNSMIGESYEETIPITAWSCPEYREDEDGELPFTGEYEFIAELPESYVCEPPISVLVTLGGAMVNTINDRFTLDGLRYKELDPDTVQLIGYDGTKPTGTLVIPERVRKPSNDREYQVISIGVGAFLDCSGLTGDLVIPDTVTEIGDRAFEGCHFTGELTLSDSLVIIGASAFYDCGFTGQLVLPHTLVRIENSAFEETTFSGQLILPEKLNYIGVYAFLNCHFTGDLIIPDGITNTGYGAFEGNSFTGTLTLPKKLKEIERESFSGCKFTGELIIPDTVTDIGHLAFYKCGFTGGLVLPDGLTIIGSDAFKECNNITGRLRIPDGITRIGDGVFAGTGIEGFDTTKQEIADLLYASGIGKDKIKVGNQSYNPAPSPQIFSAGDMDYQVIGNNTVKVTGYRGKSNMDIVIPDTVMDQSSGTTYTVTHIGSRAFGNKAITGSLFLPDTLVSIEESAFQVVFLFRSH